MPHHIGKSFTFDAAHHLPSLPADHKCSRPHGHTYRVDVLVEADELTGPGFVTDFAALTPFKRYLDERLDHRDLNAVLDFEPTSERLAEHLARWFMKHVEPLIPGRLESVRVAETPTGWAEYRVGRS